MLLVYILQQVPYCDDRLTVYTQPHIHIKLHILHVENNLKYTRECIVQCKFINLSQTLLAFEVHSWYISTSKVNAGLLATLFHISPLQTDHTFKLHTLRASKSVTDLAVENLGAWHHMHKFCDLWSPLTLPILY